MPRQVRFLTLIATAVFAVAASATSAASRADKPSGVGLCAHVDIYFVDWSTHTRRAWGPEDVRHSSGAVKQSFTDAMECQRFASWLGLDKLSPSTGKTSGDARLVIDLTHPDGRRETFYADRARLISEDGSSWRNIDHDFRKAFCALLIVPDRVRECAR